MPKVAVLRDVADDLPFLEAKSGTLRSEVANIWAMRAGLELSVSAGYAVILRELFEFGAEKPVLELCTQAATDEVAHCQLCLDLAEQIDGVERTWPKPTSLHVPSYTGVERGPLQAALHLTAMSCLNETIACVRLLEAMRPAKSATTKRALQLILADEVKHARAGWAHLASKYVTPSMKREIAKWVPELIRASMVSLIEENESIPTEQFREWGLPCLEEARSHAQRAIDEIVLPGFKRLGVSTS